MHGPGRFGKRAAVLLAAALVVAACGAVGGTISTFRALGEAGYSNPQLSSTGGEISMTVRRDAEDLDAAAARAAEIVWRKLPFPIDTLTVVCENGFGGQGSFRATRAELEAAFGERDPKLDEPVSDSELRRVGLIALALLLLGLAVLAAIVVTIVVLVRRSRRSAHRPPPPPPLPPPPPPPASPYHPQA